LLIAGAERLLVKFLGATAPKNFTNAKNLSDDWGNVRFVERARHGDEKRGRVE
jgi:hypothetical protein